MGVILETTELCGVGNFHFVFQVKPEFPKLSAQKHCSPVAGWTCMLRVPWAQESR